MPNNRAFCAGTVKVGRETYFCEGAGLYGGLGKNNTSCMKVKGADWSTTEWLRYYPDELETIEYAFAALYGSGVKETTVKVKKSRLVTKLKPFWFAALVLKISIIFCLVLLVLASRKLRGLQRVANDEVGLARLLKCTPTSVQNQYGTIESDQTPESRSSIVVEYDRGTVRLRPDYADEM